MTSVKLSTIEELVARQGADQYGGGAYHTLEPIERLDMFVCKRRLKLMLGIFYQWKSITKMRINSAYDEFSNRRYNRPSPARTTDKDAVVP